jgi:hypothetical protein
MFVKWKDMDSYNRATAIAVTNLQIAETAEIEIVGKIANSKEGIADH